MTLEDRIRNTGEHVLGSFEPSLDLHERISERVEHRVRQRRQRAAAGLGAGVVVVLGGLVGVTVGGGGSPAPVASGTASSVATFLASSIPATTAALPTAASRAEEPTIVDPVLTAPTSTSPAVAPDPTEFAAVAQGAPILLTAREGETTMRALELATGQEAEFPLDETRDGPGVRTTSAGGAYEYVLTPAGADQPCGTHQLEVRQAGVAVETALPRSVDGLQLSDDGSTGVLHVAGCEADPNSDWIGWTAFAADDPNGVVTPLDVPVVEELSGDGRYVAYSDGVVKVVEIATAAMVDTIPTGCTRTWTDDPAGILLGSDGFATLALCGDVVSLLAGRIGGVAVIEQFEECSDDARLATRSSAAPAQLPDWYAVTDARSKRAWIVGPDGVSGAIPVLDRVWWQPIGSDTAS